MTLCAAILAIGLASITVPATLAAQQDQPDTGPAQSDTLVREAPISPGGAFFRSLAIPGWAQAELGAELRGAFYFFAEATSLVMWAQTQGRLTHAELHQPEDSPLIESRKDQRENWIALAIFWALFAGADGWVSSHLYGFEEVTGTPAGEAALLQFGWRIRF